MYIEKYTNNIMTYTKTNKRSLTPTQKRFAIAFARYNNASKAVRLAYPNDYQQWSPAYIAVKGHRMLKNDNIKLEIEDQKTLMQVNAGAGVHKIGQIIKDGKEHNALQASIFAYEQVHGKAKQTTEVESKHVSVVYNLGGSNAPAIPEEILRQLEE